MNSLIGIWIYASLIYQGHSMPRPDSNLKMYFSFNTTTVNEIFYFREGEHGYCKRKANYEIKDDELIQTVISVDENNADFCSQDVDMQMGHHSVSKFKIDGENFYLELPLGDETLTYVWQKNN